jgi:hypothetical protein
MGLLADFERLKHGRLPKRPRPSRGEWLDKAPIRERIREEEIASSLRYGVAKDGTVARLVITEE